MTLADFTSPGLVVPRLCGRDAAAVIQELGQALWRGQRIPDLPQFCRAVLQRESQASTVMEAGMAFPHARLPDLEDISYAFGRSDAPLRWGADAAGSGRLVFLLAVPANDSTQYLRLISGLARLAKARPLVEKLHAAPEASQIMEVLRQVGLHPNSPAHPTAAHSKI